jgi:two-component system phosphate regulon response regulator PhoB
MDVTIEDMSANRGSATAASILVVEDESAIRRVIRFSLGRAGFNVIEAEGADEAVQRIADNRLDLVLLDWMLPGQSGLDLARRLRREAVTRDLPIIMLTARVEESDKVCGLDAGADDYVTKPFSPRELVARVRALLRRARPHADEVAVVVDGLTLDPVAHLVHAEGKTIDLGPTEFRLLRFFMTHPDRVYSRGQLLDEVWGRSSFVEERTVDVHILRLRKSLKPTGFDSYIHTVRGAGYRFTPKGDG